MRKVLLGIVAVVGLVGVGGLAVAEEESNPEGGDSTTLTGLDSEWDITTEGTTCVDDFTEDGFNVEEARLDVPPEQSDAYDDAFIIYVDGVPYFAPGFTTAGSEVSGDPVGLSGLEVTSAYRTYGDSDVLRQLTTFGNFGQSPVTVTVGWGHDRGSDGDTVTEATSSGDTTVDAGDRWVISSDGGGTDPDPRLGFVMAGVDDPATTSAPQGVAALSALCTTPEDLGVEYDLTVPAGASCSLLNFGELTPGDVDDVPAAPTEGDETTDTTVAAGDTGDEGSGGPIGDAAASADALSQITGSSPLVADLDASVRAGVVNFDLGERADGTCSEPDVLPDDEEPPPTGPVPASPAFTG